MKDSSYRFITSLLNPIFWGGRLIGEENLPKQGPAVFVANHMDALGPVALGCSIPVRLYPWLQAELLDQREAVPYLQWDLFERQLHIRPPLSRWLSWMCCKITVPLLRSFGSIPVHEHHYDQLKLTLDLSVDILREGKYVAIFPEGNRPPAVPDPVTKMYPFKHSFVRVGEAYFKATGGNLEFYPVAVHPSGFVEVGKPVAYDPNELHGLEFHRIKDILEQGIRAMYLKMNSIEASGKRGLNKARKAAQE